MQGASLCTDTFLEFCVLCQTHPDTCILHIRSYYRKDMMRQEASRPAYQLVSAEADPECACLKSVSAERYTAAA